MPRPLAAFGDGNGSGNGRGFYGRGGGGGGSDDDSNAFGEDAGSNAPEFRFSKSFAALAAATLAVCSEVPAAHAGRAPPKAQTEESKSGMQIGGLDVGGFAALFTTELGVSGAVGLGVGVMAKAAAKTALLVLTAVYALIRWLELNDFVEVKWDNLHKFVGKTTKLADLNNDGKVDVEDLQLAKAKALGFFGSFLPSASGLAAGIAVGLKL
jgi:uncharacterized membrane protein (Fun14 family)